MSSTKQLRIYKASAGSGKTFTMAREYIRLLFGSRLAHPHEHILAITFTNKATAEMKNRILDMLDEIRNGADAQKDFIELLAHENSMKPSEVEQKAQSLYADILCGYDDFMISTIDSFFVRIIRSCAYELGIADDMTVQIDTQDIITQAVNKVFLSLNAQEGKELLEWFKKYSIERLQHEETWNVRKLLKNVASQLTSEKYKATMGKHPTPTIDDVEQYSKMLRQICDSWIGDLKDKAKEALSMINNAGLSTEDFSGGKNSGLGVLQKIIDGEKKSIKEGLKTKVKGYIEDHSSAAAKTSKKRNEIIILMDSGLGDVLMAIDDMYGTRAKEYLTAKAILKNVTLVTLLAHIEKQYRELASEGRKMMLENNGELIRKIISNTDVPFVYEKLGVWLHNYMIDEFQDTSDLQWSNLRPLLLESLGKGHKNMLVGDVKQSIFRWRNSNWHLMADEIPNDPEFSKHLDTQLPPLTTNWRSRKSIVAFNNRLFAHLNDDVENLNGNYSDVCQNVSPKNEQKPEGLVSIKFNPVVKSSSKPYVPEEDNEDTEDMGEEIRWLIEHIKDCQRRGAKLNDMAILVRRNTEGSEIAQALTSNGISVTSPNALLLTQSPAVVFINALLSYIAFPDPAVKHTLLTIYARHALKLGIEESIDYAWKHQQDDIDSVLNINTVQLSHTAIHEMVLDMYHQMRLDEWDSNTTPHLLAFIDTVEDVAPTVTYSLTKFVKWWEDHKNTLFVPLPDHDAVQIMTIHKAKGLAFPIVFVPLCHWSTQAVHNEEMLWLSTDKLNKPFNTLPVVPVLLNDCKDTNLEPELQAELNEKLTDAINELYVAFTRPQCELYAFSNIELDKNHVLKQNTYATVGNLLYDFVSNLSGYESTLTTTHHELKSTFAQIGISVSINKDADWTDSAEFGKPVDTFDTDNTSQQPYVMVDIASVKTDHETIVSNSALLNAGKFQGLKFQPHIAGMPLTDDDDDAITDIDKLPKGENGNPWLNYGLLMHEVMANMTKCDDARHNIEQMQNMGHITGKEAEILHSAIEKLFGIKGVKELLDTQGRVLNEHTILDGNGGSPRPDRVVITPDNHAVIIDYKFGTEERKSHHNQVRQYARLFNKMGYTADGYLIYGSLGKLVKVQLQ
ncbi:MAG: UvrD-helicase domain-containing protein [Paludibacteraceae bacterium]|nr:UvrD-helicase domain-containing protein [Paludibacteraceae bacterium]